MKKPFDVEEFQVSEEWLKNAVSPTRKTGHKVQSPKRKLQFYKFPVRILEAVFEHYGSMNTGMACVAILLVLYETWFLDPLHRHKIQLSTKALNRFGIARNQKHRALQMLIDANVITVERTNGKNPWVTCHWLASE